MHKTAKVCARCGLTRPLKGYGMCENCYNIMYWKWDHNRLTRTFKQFMTSSPEEIEVMQEKPKRVRKQKPESKRAMHEADKWFSRYIRLKYGYVGSDGLVYCKCYTCGSIKLAKGIVAKDGEEGQDGMDCGHFKSRRFKIIRHHVNNARPQCSKCNESSKGNGMHEVFRVNLVNDLGEDAVIKLERLALVSNDEISSFELREKATYFRLKVNELQTKLNVKLW